MRSASARARSLLFVAFAWATCARSAHGAPTPSDAEAPAESITAPVLRTRVEARYPEEALRERIEGAVGLELVIRVDGTVGDVRVTAPAGHGFDDAAVAAARAFTFEPARRNGRPIPSRVQFTYEFHLPDAATSAAPDADRDAGVRPRIEPSPPPATGPSAVEEQRSPDQSSLVLATRPMSAASSRSVRDEDFRLRPVSSVADILRITPGLVVVQHAGGGKANQYFLRGFDADHGTDVALDIDGIPINLVSHGHGQGYADTTFIIPELVERVEITKGPYFADRGDFATAGSVSLITRSEFQHSSIGFAYGGSPAHGGPLYRALLVASPKLDDGRVKPLFFAEIGRTNGPFINPERFDRYKIWNKVTFEPSRASTLTLGASSYAGDWNASGQIPNREVEAGRLDRFDTLDPSQGGSSARHQLFGSYRLRPSERSAFDVSAYVASYRLDLASNFTGFLVDPDAGDQITQKDRRTFAGGKASYRFAETLGPIQLDTTFGGNVRTDSIENSLEHTQRRAFLATLGRNRIDETSFGAYVREEIKPLSWLRFIAGARADVFSFAVEDALEQPRQPEGAASGTKGASQLSPKGTVVVSPFAARDVQLDFFGNYGHGFHSNDARGVVRASGAVTPLTRAVGYETGTRARLWDRWDLAASLWRLDLASETVFLGDEGTTEPSDATRRYGVEFETRFALTEWLSADLDLTATKSAFVVNRGNGDAVALAPRTTWAGGLSARHPSGFRAGVRFYGVGDRPATQDEFLVAKGFTVFDLHAGYAARRWDIGLDVENLFDADYRSAQFATTSRLRDEPAVGARPPPGTCTGGSRTILAGTGFAGCEDIDFTPGIPLTIRLQTTLHLD